MSEEDEDDWFERALRDLDEDEEADDDVETPSESDATDDAERSDTEADDREADEDDGDVQESPSDPTPDSEEDPFGGVREGGASEEPEFDDDPAEVDESDEIVESDDPANTTDTDAGSGDRAGGFAAGDAGGFANAPDPGREPGEDEGAGADGSPSPFVDPGPGPGEQDEDDPFGGFDGGGGGQFGDSSGGGGPGGAGGAGGGFDAGGGGDEFGFADFGGGGGGGGPGGAGGPSAFDEESFESDIERIRIGVEGLDEMILGGVPRRSLISVIGSAGTGKSTLALQFLHEALRSGERAVYITLEESREAILDTAEEKGWSFRQYEEEGLLAVVPLDPIEMANSLASIRNDLTRLISEFGAERLVLDSVSLLEMMYDTPAKRRSEVFDFTRSLKQAGVTTLVTSEASEEHAYTSRYGLVEYLTDAVFILQYVRPDDFRETRLAVEIQKIRDANHSRETKPYEITDDGISVYRQANIF